MSPIYALDPELGWVPAIPEPFWYKGWRTFFRYRPACYQCQSVSTFGTMQPKLFASRAAWQAHYVLDHLQEDTKNEGHENFRS